MINQHALEAIRNAALTGENLASLFEKMANEIETIAPGALLILDYIDSEKLPVEGEFVPTVTLALKPFHLQQSTQEENQP